MRVLWGCKSVDTVLLVRESTEDFQVVEQQQYSIDGSPTSTKKNFSRP